VAYVQLKPGTTASEDELTELTRSRITERAALPKRVHIIDAMPCTVVGKLYKPELKRREIASALAAALDEAGVAAVLSVVEDKARGHIAHVVLPADADEAPVEKILGQFAVAFAIARSN
ncbi:MAG: AMP-binding enzyme, partial [Lysobacter sp.]